MKMADTPLAQSFCTIILVAASLGAIEGTESRGRSETSMSDKANKIPCREGGPPRSVPAADVPA